MVEPEVLSLERVTKQFYTTRVVDTVTFKVQAGEIYSLIGPNGAGKTTLLKMVVGLLSPTSGTITVHGHNIITDPVAAKRSFAFISDDPTPYDYLTGREFLAMTANLRGIPKETIRKKTKELVTIFPIANIIDQRMQYYSRGNKQKVVFLASLLAQPKLLIIDEPIVGLDPNSITVFGKQLERFAKDGGAVLMATHILSFAEEHAHTVGILHEGKLVTEKPVTKNQSLSSLYESVIAKA